MNDAVVCRYMQYLGVLMCLSECITVCFFFFFTIYNGILMGHALDSIKG